jgi:hypothetical protein
MCRTFLTLVCALNRCIGTTCVSCLDHAWSTLHGLPLTEFGSTHVPVAAAAGLVCPFLPCRVFKNVAPLTKAALPGVQAK